MNSRQFYRVIKAFADHSADLQFDRDSIIVQVRDELIDASVREKDGEVFVRENGAELRAHSWIRDRVAKIPQLADRVQAHIPHEEFFIPPSGTFLDQLDNRPSASQQDLADARTGINETLDQPAFYKSTVLYLTSDAGEGKTTLINHLAHLQAKRFKARESSFLLVPISLAGRAFLSFDDIVIAELVNRFRFPFFYYDAFVELVRMNIVVPAFDGFEEMFVESSTGEAASALGHLLHGLESSGSVVLAARRAFFEYRHLATQAQLFDAIGDRNVGFAQVRLERWDRTHFVQYARKRSVADPESVYDRLRQRLEDDHPSLTRAVLVRRLLDVIESGDIEELLLRLGNASSDYFHEFVNALVSREAQKWIDRSGSEGPQRALLSVEEHHSLLAEIAMEMWLTSSDVISTEHLDIVMELFAEGNQKEPQIESQVKQRIRHHALLVGAVGRARSVRFDHDDFRNFYLGEALAELLGRPGQESESVRVLGLGPLSRVASDAAANALGRRGVDVRTAIERLREVVREAPPISYGQENAGAIVCRLLEMHDEAVKTRLAGFSFPSDALRGRGLGASVFEKCRFQGTSLAEAVLSNCEFIGCRFDRLEMTPEFDADGAILRDCRIACLVSKTEPDGVFAPERIDGQLERAGFRIERTEPAESHDPSSIDPDAELAERALRSFLRGTQINENVLRQRLGSNASEFFDRILPKLIEGGVLRSVEYHGKGQQRRFGLAVPMSGIASAVPTTAASFDEFLEAVHRGRRAAPEEGARQALIRPRRLSRRAADADTERVVASSSSPGAGRGSGSRSARSTLGGGGDGSRN